MTIIDDHFSYRDGEDRVSRSRGDPLLNQMKRIVIKKRVITSFFVIFFILALFGGSLAAYFFLGSKTIRSFKSAAIEHIESTYPYMEPSKRAELVDEIVKIRQTGKITSEASDELDVLIEFDSFVEKHKRVHKTFDQRLERFLIFRKNFYIVRAHKVSEPYSLELNKFADLSEEEFKALYPVITPPKAYTSLSKHLEFKKMSYKNPIYISKLKEAKGVEEIKDISLVTGENLDWTRTDTVSPVKDQGDHCGSCWAFSSIGSVESLYRLYKNKSYFLSEQELVNCDKSSMGCSGGLPITAMEYIHSKGISFESEIPYIGIDAPCRPSIKNKVFVDSISILKGNDVVNKSLVISPTVVAIAATRELKLYQGGVYTGKCGDALNHAVLLVGEGYDEETGLRYWIIKNSWGEDWGENGFLRLERTKKGLDKCGILTFGLNPILYSA
ncbi:Papain family cysteine protease family protein [Theileria parva strain Muguga]|uniref:Cysteine proteinase, putative n=1 Tax=Theileria parva TaxID=5875 RepID=Q4N068_THEPA|nr:Papain family cysteine protease family protein [Theileria parva strain Muguga]EAN31018.1 Papain family cysteine protease family protein [Theileria parva strain Muguga]|eukprot:XP_763301.1 cysteine proteinase [Theileria parva strain Muguga]